MYDRTKWIDEVKDQDTGEIIQEGTDQSAGNFNNMENGISDASAAAALLLIASGLLQQQTAVEKHVVTLTNTMSQPFNNSQQTISLNGTKDSTDYFVDVEIADHDGNVGDVKIYDKQVNGFKVKFEGSATSVTLILRVQGGI